eukprot:m.264090 g.264090  ORF g.264090 m.264090 type:complete len:566 (+) comp17618_c0_seq1:1187-2884(+)
MQSLLESVRIVDSRRWLPETSADKLRVSHEHPKPRVLATSTSLSVISQCPMRVVSRVAHSLRPWLWQLRRANSHVATRLSLLKDYESEFGPSYTVPSSIEPTQLSRHATFAATADLGSKVAAKPTTICGRVYSKRTASTKLHFYDLRDASGKLQVLASKAASTDPERFSSLHATLRKGDVIEVHGQLGRTKRGEPTLFATQAQLLSPCLHDLPEQLEDKEVQVRDRPLHMLINPSLGQTLKLRHTVVSTLRKYLCQQDFVEVETPVLASLAGGATARPFVTQHNALNADLQLRIAPELYLKRLVIGGLDRVFEIGKVFRNEGVDSSHNPEFTTCEFYMAYARFDHLLSMTTAIVTGIAQAAITAGFSHAERLGLAKDGFDVVSYLDVLSQHVDSATMAQLRTDPEAAVSGLLQACTELNIRPDEAKTAAALVDKLGSVLVEDKCIKPTFVIDHPLVLSPLAMEHPTKPGAALRMELFVQGLELCNAYQELTSPDEQRERFLAQLRARQDGDDESPVPDEDYCRALEYGLPPTVGWGMGIDRLVMLLSDQHHIRDVLSFPVVNAKS